MSKNFPDEYDFFPRTYCLPIEYNKLSKAICNNFSKDFYIMKPEAASQGRGIFLSKDIADISPGDHLVA